MVEHGGKTKKYTIPELLERIVAAVQTCGWVNFGMGQELEERLKWKPYGVFVHAHVMMYLKKGIIVITIFCVWMQEDAAIRILDCKPFLHREVGKISSERRLSARPAPMVMYSDGAE